MVISAQRKLELVSRGVLLFSIFPPAWLIGTAGLSVAKIMDNSPAVIPFPVLGTGIIASLLIAGSLVLVRPVGSDV